MAGKFPLKLLSGHEMAKAALKFKSVPRPEGADEDLLRHAIPIAVPTLL
jgi:hypothetical protein